MLESQSHRLEQLALHSLTCHVLQAIVSSLPLDAKVDANSIAAAAHPWPYDERGIQKLLQDTNSTLASMADWR